VIELNEEAIVEASSFLIDHDAGCVYGVMGRGQGTDGRLFLLETHDKIIALLF